MNSWNSLQFPPVPHPFFLHFKTPPPASGDRFYFRVPCDAEKKITLLKRNKDREFYMEKVFIILSLKTPLVPFVSELCSASLAASWLGQSQTRPWPASCSLNNYNYDYNFKVVCQNCWNLCHEELPCR